jgi:hypothetical protein
MEGYFNVNAKSLTLEQGINFNKCFEGLGFNNFYVQSPCKHLIEDYTEIFYMIQEGDVPFVQCEVSLRGPKSMRDVDGPNLIFIDFNVPALELRINWIETALQLSENITLFAICGIHTSAVDSFQLLNHLTDFLETGNEHYAT